MRKRPRHKPDPLAPKYEPCSQCLGGWVTVWTTREGFVPLPTVERCWCWRSWQAKLAEASQ